jgi:hypothetical protein
MHADLCRPAEVREVYISRLIEDDGTHEHVDILPKNMDLSGSGAFTLSVKATLDDEHDEHFHTIEGDGNIVITPGPATVSIGTAAPVICLSGGGL